MKMTDSEIIQDYREAKNPKAQVEILADRNLVSKKEMAQWLLDHGQKVDRRILLGRSVGPGMMKRQEEPKEPEGSKVTIPEPEEVMEAFMVVGQAEPPEAAEKLTEIDRLCAENEKLRNDLGDLAERDAKAINQLRAENEQLRKDMQEMAMEDTNRIEELEEELEKFKAAPADPDQAVKADAGKPRLSLVPMQIMFDIAEVREFGNRKYPDGGVENWRRVDAQRYRDAAMRHMVAYIRDPEGVDAESGLPHRWHLECNLAFLSELEGEDEHESNR